MLLFQSTHPARGATHFYRDPAVRQIISIHAPREGCDAGHPHADEGEFLYFNPRTPRGVRRSTVPPPLLYSNFNPRTPRGVRRAFDRGRFRAGGISIHAPREGCDAPTASERRTTWTFQSTHPARGATFGLAVADQVAQQFQSTHPARGATEDNLDEAIEKYLFQSTHPARGATGAPLANRQPIGISIHAPREGCDRQAD